jgi:membrane-associated phospholipid phosphatase
MGLALLGLARGLPPYPKLVLLGLPWVLYSAWWTETKFTRPWTRVVRDWSALALILVAYWCLQLFAAGHLDRWPQRWIVWDRWLLNQAGLRRAVEAAGDGGPFVLELLYLLLYTLPTTALGVVYASGRRPHIRRFLLILFLGTLSAYSLLPVWPVASPQILFPGADLPAFSAFPRSLNLWLLQRLDIATSVFPSGHVAVAFSVAFGLLSALPHRRRWGWIALAVAGGIYTATIYGRYHYAVDGLASIAVVTLAWRAAVWLMRGDPEPLSP